MEPDDGTVRRWALVDDDGTVTNVVLWDGVTPWPGGERAVPVPDGAPAEPGGSWDGTTFTRAPTVDTRD